MSEQQTEIVVQTSGGEKKMTAADFMGKSKWQAQGKAEANNLIFRLIRVDNRAMLSMPTDKRTDRVCIEIDNGEVTKVTFV